MNQRARSRCADVNASTATVRNCASALGKSRALRYSLPACSSASARA